MRVLITGSRGFLGLNLQDYLGQNPIAEHSFTFVDRDDGNLINIDDAYALVQGHDIVVHMAGIVGTGEFYNKFGNLIYNDITTMDNNVIDACIEHNVKKLIYIGSGSAYSPNVVKDGLLKEEDFFIGLPDEYTMGYGYAKRNAWVSMFLSKVPSVYLAMSTMYGKYQIQDYKTGSFVSATFAKFKNKEPHITIGGTGKPQRDFISVDTAVWIISKFIKEYIPSNRPEIFNVGGPGPLSVREAVDIMKDVFDYDGTISYDTTKPDGMIMRVLDNSKLYKEFPEVRTDYSPVDVFRNKITELKSWSE